MHRIEYSLLARSKIKSFLEYRTFYYNTKFNDTGIFEEDIMRKMLILELRKWADELTIFINSSLSSGILGEIQEINSTYEIRKIVLSFGNYKLVLEIRKWLTEKIITIEDIVIQS